MNVKDFDQLNDVIDIPSSKGDTEFLQGKNIYLPRDLLSLIHDILGKSNSGLQPLFNREILCRVMTVDKAKWQKGRIKLTLEFIPDPDELTQYATPQDELNSIRNQNID